jgi:hypothetical protein
MKLREKFSAGHFKARFVLFVSSTVPRLLEMGNPTVSSLTVECTTNRRLKATLLITITKKQSGETRRVAGVRFECFTRDGDA